MINKMKISSYFGKNYLKEKSSFLYRNNYRINSYKNSMQELKEEIFNNIIRPLSSNNYITGNKYNSKINKNSHINIMTMMELNYKAKSKDNKKFN